MFFFSVFPEESDRGWTHNVVDLLFHQHFVGLA